MLKGLLTCDVCSKLHSPLKELSSKSLLKNTRVFDSHSCKLDYILSNNLRLLTSAEGIDDIEPNSKLNARNKKMKKEVYMNSRTRDSSNRQEKILS